MGKFLVVLLALLFGYGAVGQKGEPLELDPLTDWEVERLPDRCIIRRAFGGQNNPTVLELQSIDPWNGGFHLSITTDRYGFENTPFSVGWLPGGKFLTVNRFELADNRQGRPIIRFNNGLWDAASWNLTKEESTRYFAENGPDRFVSSVEGLLFEDAFERPIFLKTGPMDQIIEKRDQCVERMLIGQDVDPADINRSDTRVTMRNSYDLMKGVYKQAPENMRSDSDYYGLTFLFYVNSSGRATSCRLSSLPNDDRYEDWACHYLIERAQFDFKSGEAVQSTWFKITVR